MLRRLPWNKWPIVLNMMQMGSPDLIPTAVRLGLVRIEGGPFEDMDLEGPATPSGIFTDADMVKIDRAYRREMLEIGTAVCLANNDTRADEGKLLGS